MEVYKMGGKEVRTERNNIDVFLFLNILTCES